MYLYVYFKWFKMLIVLMRYGVVFIFINLLDDILCKIIFWFFLVVKFFFVYYVKYMRRLKIEYFFIVIFKFF